MILKVLKDGEEPLRKVSLTEGVMSSYEKMPGLKKPAKGVIIEELLGIS